MTTGRPDVDHVLDAIDGAIGDWTMPDAMRWIPEGAREEPPARAERHLPGMEDPPPGTGRERGIDALYGSADQVRHWLRDRYLTRRADAVDAARWATFTPDPPAREPHQAGRLYRENAVDSVLDWLPLARQGLGKIAVLACTPWDFDRWCDEQNLPRSVRGREVFCVADTGRDLARLRSVIVLAAVQLDGFEDHPRHWELLGVVLERLRPLAPAELRRAADAAIREAVERYGPHAHQSPSWPGGALRQMRAQQFARPWEPDQTPEAGEARVAGLAENMARFNEVFAGADGPITWEDVRAGWEAMPAGPGPAQPPARFTFEALRAGMDRIAANNRYSRMIPPHERVFGEADTAAALEYLAPASHGHGLIAVLACNELDFDRWRQEWNLPHDCREVFYISDTQCGPQRLRGAHVLATVVLNGFEVHPRSRELSGVVSAQMRPIARNRSAPGVRGVSAGPAVLDETVTFHAGGRAYGRTSVLGEEIDRMREHIVRGIREHIVRSEAGPPDNVVAIANHCWCGTPIDRIEQDRTDFEPHTEITALADLPTRVLIPRFALSPCGHQVDRVRVETTPDGRRLVWLHPRSRSCQ